MKLEIHRFRTTPSRCRYLSSQIACLDNRVILSISPAEYELMLSRGWRRMGCFFFRPACPACAECRSLRVPTQSFAPDRSQRRAWQRNARLRVVVQAPTVSTEHLRLWNEYHSFMRNLRDWPESPMTPDDYEATFLTGQFSFSREFLYYDEDRLVGVGLVDLTPDSLSSIYFFHDPAWRKPALGIFSVLKEIEYARQSGLSFAYLGYWIRECPSMAYKAQYRPHELLEGFPADDANPDWRDPEDSNQAGPTTGAFVS